MSYADGGMYEGGWKEDEKDGKGKEISKEGDVEYGVWKDGELLKKITENEFYEL